MIGLWGALLKWRWNTRILLFLPFNIPESILLCPDFDLETKWKLENFLLFFFFSVSFYPLLSLASGLTPSGHFWGKRRGNKAGEKKPGEWAKARQKKCRGELRRGMKVKLSTTVTRYLPHPLLIFTFLVCVWPQSSGNHSDCILTEFSNKRFLLLKDPNQSIDTICTTSHLCCSNYMCECVHMHTHTYELHGPAEGKIPVKN